MLTQLLNRTDPERVLINVKNTDASSLTTGYGVALCFGEPGVTVSADGVNALLLGTDTNLDGETFIGVAYKDIAANGYGLVCCWGANVSVALSAEANKTIGNLAGAGLLQKSAVAGLFTSTLSPQAVSTYCGKYLLQGITTNISGGQPYGSAFVRCF